MTRQRVLYVTAHYPQLSETYIENEIRALAPRHAISVIALREPDMHTDRHHDYRLIRRKQRRRLSWAIARAAPDVIHGHWLGLTRTLHDVSERAGVPFTVRSHSFDTLGEGTEQVRRVAPLINGPRCLGVLCFPFVVDRLVAAGIERSKLVPCFPVVDYRRFHDESPNGDGVLNVGACIPKKAMESYLQLAASRPGQRFDLYPIGYGTAKLAALNDTLGAPVAIHSTVQPEAMPAVYKRHEWLVYSASPVHGTVGWPMAVAEAQAAGVGVCMQNLRPDLRDYVGEAGYLFDTLDEVREIISRPFPEEKRRRGFELAKRSDIFDHVALLEGLWEAHSSTPRRLPPTPAWKRAPLAYLSGR